MNFTSFKPFSDFYLIFNWIFKYFISENSEKGEKLPAADVATGPRRQADVARGSNAPLRRGAEATWQDACGPRGAQVALTRD